EADLVTFIQALQARTLNGGDMDESVLLAIVGRNEAVALGGVEEFHGTGNGGHLNGPLGLLCRRLRRKGLSGTCNSRTYGSRDQEVAKFPVRPVVQIAQDKW